MNRKRNLSVTVVTLILLGSFSAQAQRYDRGYDFSSRSDFVAKGTWAVGGTASYALHDYRNYSVAVVENINSTGYRLVASPAFCYMFRDNMGAGLRLDYSRKMLRLDSASAGFGDMSLDIKDYHLLNHRFTAKGILRNYIPLGNSRRFAMFNETQLSVGFGQGKIMDGHGDWVRGSYDKTSSFGINLCPGLVAFASNHLAVELNVNMMGLNVSHVGQTHNQVWHGSRNTTSVNFRVNVLSVGFGLYYYFSV